MKEKVTLKEKKRAAILEAAIGEFRDKGYQQASMDSISARAQVSKRTVYNHFASKEVLFEAIISETMLHCAVVTGFSYTGDQPVADQLRIFAEKEIQLLSSEQFTNLMRVMMAEFIHQPELAHRAAEQFNQQEQGLNAWIIAAIEDGKLQPVEPSYAAEQFIGLIKANAFWPQLLGGAPFPTPEQCQQIIDDTILMFMARYGK